MLADKAGIGGVTGLTQVILQIHDGRAERPGAEVENAPVAPLLGGVWVQNEQAFLHLQGPCVVFLADATGAPAGFTQLYPSFSSVSLARTFILNDLFVVPSARRTGVGSELLRAATEYARSLGAVRVTLNTDIGNTTAQAVYEARGWKRDREYFVYHFAPQG